MFCFVAKTTHFYPSTRSPGLVDYEFECVEVGKLVFDLASVSVQVLKVARELSFQMCHPTRLVYLHAGRILKPRALPVNFSFQSAEISSNYTTIQPSC